MGSEKSYKSRKSKKSKHSSKDRRSEHTSEREARSKVEHASRKSRERSRSQERHTRSVHSSDRRKNTHSRSGKSESRSHRSRSPSDLHSRSHRTGDNQTTLSYGESWTSSKEQELKQLRELVKQQKITDEFSFSPSEINSIARDPSLGESDANESIKSDVYQSSPVVQDDRKAPKSKSMEDVIFEGVQSDPKGPPVGDISNRLIEDWFAKDIDSEYTKTLREKYPEPENTEHLSPKLMNVEIFRTLHESLKKRDFVLKSIQHNMLCAATANFRLIDELMASKDNLPADIAQKLASHSSAATKLLAKASSDLSVARKQLLKNHLHFKYAPLCSQRCYTKNLFGEDLSKALKEADELSKLTRAIPRATSSFKSDKVNHYGQRFSPMYQNKQKSGRFLKAPRTGYQQQFAQKQYKKPNKMQTQPNQKQ